MPFTAQPTEKCTACGHTVYATERTVVEDLAEKKVYHKQCIRCQSCNKVLSVGQFSAMDGKFWCKPHFKQLFASKGNYDEPFGKEKRRDSVATSTPPTSFIPEVKSEPKSEKKQTSEETLAKFRKFREEGDTDKCVVCTKTVYLAEKLIVEDKNDKRTFHKTCFKCSVCELKLDLRSYGSIDGKLYCKNHLKENSKINAPAPSSAVVSPSSFIPEVEKSNTQNSKETPEHIASKFKGLGSQSDKCKACGKSVYATEKSVLTEGFGRQVTYHKQCLKCNVCSVKLDVSNYGIANGILFCQVHLKQYGKPEQVKSDNAYFVSPLAATDPTYNPGPKDADGSTTNTASNYQDDDLRGSDNRDRRDSDSYVRSTSGGEEEEHSSVADREEVSPQSEQSEDYSKQERSPSPEPAQSSPQQQKRSSLRESTDDDSKRKEEERQRRREERLKQQQEEEKKEEEEREKRRLAREQRLKEISTGNEDSSVSSPTSDDSDRSKREAEREERRKRREEERKREEEEREREESRRKREREERKRQQDELAARELEEQEKKAEERRRKLEELKNSS